MKLHIGFGCPENYFVELSCIYVVLNNVNVILLDVFPVFEHKFPLDKRNRLFVGDGPLGDPLLDLGQLDDLLGQVGDLGVGALPLAGEGEGAEVQPGGEDEVGNGHLEKCQNLSIGSLLSEVWMTRRTSNSATCILLKKQVDFASMGT